jgi:hypothetical protein
MGISLSSGINASGDMRSMQGSFNGCVGTVSEAALDLTTELMAPKGIREQAQE